MGSLSAMTLYQIDSFGIASKSSALDVSRYAGTYVGEWILTDGDTFSRSVSGYVPQIVIGLDSGDTLVSIIASSPSLAYGYAIPEPSTMALLLGAGILVLVRRRRARNAEAAKIKLG